MLKQMGHEVRIFEATSPAESQTGGIMGLDSTELGYLTQLGIPRTEITPGGFARNFHNLVGGQETYIDASGTTDQHHLTSWPRIHGVLDTRLSIEYGKRVQEIAHGRLTLSDGETIGGDLIIFADGRRSLGRKTFDPRRTLSYAGYVNWRGIVRDFSPLPKRN